MNVIMLLCGLHSLFFGVFHCMFWDKLGWKKELPKLHNSNNAVMQILNLRMIYLCFFFAFLFFFYSDEILQSRLGKALLVGMSLFWIGRTIEQFVYGKLLDNKLPISIFLIFLFVMGSVIYLIPLFYA